MRFEGNAPSVAQSSRYALSMPCIAQSNALMLPTKERRTGRRRRRSTNKWRKRFPTSENSFPSKKYNNKNYALSAKGYIFTSERLTLVKDVTKVKLRIGTWEKEDTFTIKMAVEEDDLFDF